MTSLFLVGIGTGNPEHLTLQAIRVLNGCELILIPCKGEDKAALAELRRSICAEVITNPATRIVEFDMPVRDPANPDYRSRVENWHDAIADCWRDAIASAPADRVALLVWGDPALYDSTLRIAARLGRRGEPIDVTVVPGITSIQALAAAHRIPLNELGEAFTITTGRRLRDHGWPSGVDTLIVMLDGDCAFNTLAPDGIRIWWGAYLGMPEEITLAGPLGATAGRIVALREEARQHHGWIMDLYLLRR